MTDQDTSKQTRGKGFPVMSLPEARDVVIEAGQFGKEHHMDAFAGYMGHQKASGGAFNNRIAAIRDWGLITRGSGRIALTPLGQKIAFPVDGSDSHGALREAFLGCSVMKEAFDRTAKGQSISESAFGNAAVLNLGISPGSKDRFVKSFAASASAVGLAEVANGSLVLADGSTPEQSDPADSAVTAVPTGAEPRSIRESPPAFEQMLRFDGGALYVKLDLDGNLPRTAFTRLNIALAELLDDLESATASKPVVDDSNPADVSP